MFKFWLNKLIVGHTYVSQKGCFSYDTQISHLNFSVLRIPDFNLKPLYKIPVSLATYIGSIATF